MADQFQICENADKESLEITLGYDMDGHAQLASVLQVFLCIQCIIIVHIV